MEIEYQLTHDDVEAFTQHALRSWKTRVVSPITVTLFLATVAFFLFVFPALKGEEPLTKLAELDVWAPTLALVGGWLFLWSALNGGRKHSLTEMRERGFFDKQRLTIRPEGVFRSCVLSEGLTKWPLIKRVEATSEYIYFWLSEGSAFFVPGKAFQNRDHFMSFVDQARKYHEAARATGALQEQASHANERPA
jgi:YcxB-like protein